MELEAALTAQVGSKPADQVTELVLDTCKLASTALAGLEKFSNLTRLTLNGCSLTSLEGFPQLDNLKSLELTDNQLSEGLEALQDAGLLALTRLSLAGNRFASLDSLEPLTGVVMLNDLDLYNCPVTEVDGYRQSIFDMLGNLKYLDGFDADDNEKDDEDDDGDGDDDLLSSEVGDEDDDDLGEDDEDDLGESDLGDEDDLGEEGSELGEEGDDDGGEESDGEEGEEGGEEDDEDEGEDDESETAQASKRQRR